jgi:hypothetical protein
MGFTARLHLFFHGKIIIAEHLIIGPERALEAITKRLREKGSVLDIDI